MYHAGIGTFLQRDPLPQDGEPVLMYSHGYATARMRDQNLYAYTSDSPINATDPSGTVTVWDYGLPKNFDRWDYHGQEACDPATDTCNTAIAKLQAWITNGAIRSYHLYGYLITALEKGTLTPLQYKSHMNQLRNTNRHIIQCWIVVKEKCSDCDPNKRQLPSKPYAWKVPKQIPNIKPQPLPWWVPQNPANDIYQDIGIGIGIAGAVFGGAWALGLGGGAAAGGGAAGGAATIAFPTGAGAATSDLIAAGLLVSFTLSGE